MIPPLARSTDQPQPLSSFLHNIDRRLEVIINEALKQNILPNNPVLFQQLRHIQQVHPKVAAPLEELLQQFGSLHLDCQGESIPINQQLAQATSPVLKAQSRFETSETHSTLSKYSPETIKVLTRLLERQTLAQDELLAHAGELLAIGDELQIELVTRALVAARADFTRFSPSDFRALLTQARNHHNFIVYLNLLHAGSAEPTYQPLFTAEERELLDHENFENIQIHRQIIIRINTVEIPTLYAKMCKIPRTSVGGALTTIIHPPRAKTGSFLRAVKSVFDEHGWPNKVEYIRVNLLEALKTFFNSPQKAGQLEAIELTSSTIGDPIIAGLPKNINLKELVLEVCGLTNHSAQDLARYLSTFTTLERLSLKGNSYGAVGLPFIMQALTRHPNFSTLDLTKNHLDEKAIEGLTPLLPPTLILAQNPLGDLGAARLASILRQAHTIQHLDLSGCNIGDEGIKVLCRALCDNPLLYTLKLGSNPFSSEATAALCELLSNGVTLTYLDLTEVAFTETDFCALAKSLKENKQLARLDLVRTGVTDKAAKALSQMLLINQTLSVLIVQSTKITDTGAKLLCGAIQHKKQFELAIPFNNLSDKLTAELKQNPQVSL